MGFELNGVDLAFVWVEWDFGYLGFFWVEWGFGYLGFIWVDMVG